jgi:hypothetical protein
MIEALLVFIVILLIAINKNLIVLRKESRKWLTEIAENTILRDNSED